MAQRTNFRFPLVLVLMLALVSVGAPRATYSQKAPPPSDINQFFQTSQGDWVGSITESTNGKMAAVKYFQASVTRSGDGYETVFKYYSKLDPRTGAPVPAGAASMRTRVTSNVTATNVISGSGIVYTSPTTPQPESHELTEVLTFSAPASLRGKGTGRITVGGKSGKVTEYASTWSTKNGILTIEQQLTVTFRSFVFSRKFRIVDSFVARRGTDVAAVIKATGNLQAVPGP